MPNYCFYDLNITGKPDDVERVVNALKAEYNYTDPASVKHEHLYRVFEAEVYHDETDEFGVKTTGVRGNCAWSVGSCMMGGQSGYYSDFEKRYGKDNKGTCLENLTKETNTIVEIYSEETGCCFQEHIVVNHGIVLLDETVDYHEICLDDVEEDHGSLRNFLNTEASEIERQAIIENMDENGELNDDFVGVGGFSDWEFEDYSDAFRKDVKGA